MRLEWHEKSDTRRHEAGKNEQGKGPQAPAGAGTFVDSQWGGGGGGEWGVGQKNTQERED